MAIMIQEYYNFKFTSLTSPKQNLNVSESFSPQLGDSVIAEIEGIHVGATRNFTRYMESALKGSRDSWLHPYKKPLIMHHNEEDGKIIGRIQSVEYKTKDTKSGTPALKFTATVSDADGKEQVKDGRLNTVSIGAIAHDVRCSICNKEIINEDGCEDGHIRGNVYNGQICYWDIYEMEGKELSFVIVPSDIYAQTVKIYDAPKQNNNIDLGESFKTEGGKGMTIEELKKQVEDLTSKCDALVVDLDKKSETLKKVEDEKKEIEAAKEKVQKDLEELEKDKKDTDKKLAEATEEIKKEKELREAAESASIELKESARESMAENLALLRSVTGKPVTESMVKDRSFESIKDAVKDLKEELGSTFDVYNIKPAQDPTITQQVVTEKKEVKKVDLQEEMLNIFSGCAGIKI